MSMSKISLSIGGFTFAGEGTEEWVASQLAIIMKEVSPLLSNSVKNVESNAVNNTANVEQSKHFNKTLVSFLKELNISSQNDKYLATALWLTLKGSQRFTTREVNKALKDSNQTKLGNPSECLAQNVTKGHCEKDGDKYFVTSEGYEHLNFDLSKFS